MKREMLQLSLLKSTLKNLALSECSKLSEFSQFPCLRERLIDRANITCFLRISSESSLSLLFHSHHSSFSLPLTLSLFSPYPYPTPTRYYHDKLFLSHFTSNLVFSFTLYNPSMGQQWGIDHSRIYYFFISRFFLFRPFQRPPLRQSAHYCSTFRDVRRRIDEDSKREDS